MKEYSGEEFLNKIYRDLFNSSEVQFSARGRNKNEDVSLYMDRLDRVTNKAIENDHLEVLKKLYYDKYVIKEEDIKDSYFEALRIHRGRVSDFSEEEKKEEIRKIISDQKYSLDKWIDYFASDDSSIYPTWFKYFCFQGMVRLGNFNKEKGIFSRRNASTVGPFVELNEEAISFIYEELIKVLDKRELNDREIEKILENGSFSKIYAYIIQKLEAYKLENYDNNDVKWKFYKKGSRVLDLVNDLEGKHCGWCITYPSVAQTYLKDSDFHIAYTKDGDGEYTVPRVAFCVKNGVLSEIRGVCGLEDLEFEMIDATQKKMSEFQDDNGKFEKAIEDIKKIKLLIEKRDRGEDFTNEELMFLYEIDNPIVSFGLEEDPRVEELKESRNSKEDFIKILDYKYRAGKDGVFGGELVLKEEYGVGVNDIKMPRVVNGNFEIVIDDVLSDDEIILPEFVGGDVKITIKSKVNKLAIPNTPESIRINGINNVKNLDIQDEVKKDLYIWDEVIDHKLNMPNKVYRDFRCPCLKEVRNFDFSKVVDGNLYLPFIEKMKNVALPEELNGNLEMFIDNNFNTAINISFPKEMKQDLIYKHLKKFKNVDFPKKLNANNIRLESDEIENIVLPEEFGGNLVISGSEVVKDITVPDGFNGSVYINCNEIENIEFPKDLKKDVKIAGIKVKNVSLPEEINDTVALNFKEGENVVLPQVLNGNLYLNGMSNLNGITMSKKINGILSAEDLEDIDDLDLSDSNVKSVYMPRVKKINHLKLPETLDDLKLGMENNFGVELPKVINGDLLLSELRDASGLVLPKKIGGILYLNSLDDISGLIIPDELDCEFYSMIYRDGVLNLRDYINKSNSRGIGK